MGTKETLQTASVAHRAKTVPEERSKEMENNNKNEGSEPADDNISSMRFHHIKSYANILSSGVHKVRETFRPKTKVEKKENIVPDVPEFVHPALKDEEKEQINKPEIPGLIFKGSIPRRPSRKGRKSKSPHPKADSPEKEKVNKTSED